MVVNIEQLRNTANPYTHIQNQGPQTIRLIVNLRRLISYGELTTLIASGRFGPIQNYFDAGGVSVPHVEICLDWLVAQLDRVRRIPEAAADHQTTAALMTLIGSITNDLQMSRGDESNVPIRNRTNKEIQVLNDNEHALIAHLFIQGSPLFDEGLPGDPVVQQQQPGGGGPPDDGNDIDDQDGMHTPPEILNHDDQDGMHTPPEILNPDPNVPNVPNIPNVPVNVMNNNNLVMAQPNLMQQRIDPLVLATLFGQKGGRKRKAQGKKSKQGKLRVPVKRRRNKTNMSDDDDDDEEEDAASSDSSDASSSDEEDSGFESE